MGTENLKDAGAGCSPRPAMKVHGGKKIKRDRPAPGNGTKKREIKKGGLFCASRKISLYGLPSRVKAERG